MSGGSRSSWPRGSGRFSVPASFVYGRVATDTTSPTARSNVSCARHRRRRSREAEASGRYGSAGDQTGRPFRSAFRQVRHRPALGGRLHLRRDVVRTGLRRVCVRRSVPPHHRLAHCDEYDYPAAGLPRHGALHPAPRRRARVRRAHAPHRRRQRQHVDLVRRRLVDEGINPSVGSVGDAFDNSFAESLIGRYKSELIHHADPWRDVDQFRAATASRVLWFNNEPTHGSIDDLTPLKVEQLDYAHIETVEREPADTSNTLSGHAGASHIHNWGQVGDRRGPVA